MKEFQRKQKIRKRLYSLPVLVVLLIMLVFIVKGTFEIIGKVMVSRSHVKTLEEKALALSLRSQELEEDIANLETEDGVKRELKEKFNVVEDGERVVVVVDEGPSGTSTESSSESWTDELWLKIKSIF